MHPTFIAVISPVPAVIMLITVGLVGFCAWKIRSTMQAASRAARKREMDLVASLPGAPAIVMAGGLAPVVVVPDEVPTLDALVLPSHAPEGNSPTTGPVTAMDKVSLQALPSPLVLAAVEELRAGAQSILDAGTERGDEAAADVMIAVATGRAVTALALAAGEPKLR